MQRPSIGHERSVALAVNCRKADVGRRPVCKRNIDVLIPLIVTVVRTRYSWLTPHLGTESAVRSKGGCLVEWGEHKHLAESSRQIIVIPYLLRALSAASSPCIDIGCGSADLTSTISSKLNLSIVGIDKAIPEAARAEPANARLHFVEADITKNGILEAGINFNTAFSNCCFCHVDDDQVIAAFADLFNSLNPKARFVFLVPSISWASALYDGIEHTPSGITAIPRSGSRQYFRIPPWYTSALQRAGFIEIEHEELLVPESEQLAERYLSRAGQSIFSAFMATRGETTPDLALKTKAFDVAHENRKLEIQLFWQRSLFFWGFVAASLVAYAQTIKDHQHYSIVFALFGLVCSIVWSRGNRGSKYWQEYWEKKVNFYQHFTTGNIFYDRRPTKPRFFEVFEGRRASVSKLTMALSDFSIGIWSLLCLLTFLDESVVNKYGRTIALGLVLVTLLYCLFFLWNAKSED